MTTVYRLIPNTKEVKDWIKHNVQYESYQRIGKGIAIEHRFIVDIIKALLSEGFLPPKDFVVGEASEDSQ